MTEFLHSQVLFAGDDGLPMQFNIQNTTEKEFLKALIEHGGGMCTLSDEAIILVSPGTKVLSVLANKCLISSRYILDCVKDDCLLDTDEYRVEINEMEASDFSDSSNLQVNSQALDSNKKLPGNLGDDSIDIIQTNKLSLPQNLTCPNSNHDFDSQCTENRSIPVAEVLKNHDDEQQNSQIEFPLQSSENHIHFGLCADKVNNFHNCVTAVPNSFKIFHQSVNAQEGKINERFGTTHVQETCNEENPVVVSSSQEIQHNLDKFDNMILNKVQEKPVPDEDSLSQSYTVSSSADAQVSPNQPPSHHTSAELFDGSSAAPDSASQSTERQQYINNLEKEIEQILQKPSPKSIQDKTVLVKYICTVKKLAPAIVLQTLQRF